MKINVTKISAARSQLIEAINLFFEERDPISIHTLVGASLQILNDHITNTKDVYDNGLVLRFDTIYVDDEFRKLWIRGINKARNFFKHADNDKKKSIEFETDLNEIYIHEALRCLKIVEGEDHVFSIEFKIFMTWFCLKHHDSLTPEGKEYFLNLPYVEAFQTEDLKEWKEMMRITKINKTV